MICWPLQNKEVIFSPNIFLPWIKLNQMSRTGSGRRWGKAHTQKNLTEFITHWSCFSYEMPTNLWPGERSQVRIQYRCLFASVFIRHFLKTGEGRLRRFTEVPCEEDSSVLAQAETSPPSMTLFCCDGLICCLFTGRTGLPWQADRGTDPRARLKPGTGNDLSHALSSFTLANGLQGPLSKVSRHGEQTFTLSVTVTHADRGKKKKKKAKSLKELRDQSCGTTPKDPSRHMPWPYVHLNPDSREFSPPRRMSASNGRISASLWRLKKTSC